MKYLFLLLILNSFIEPPVFPLQDARPNKVSQQVMNLRGRWRVKFDLTGTGEKNLLFDLRRNGSGSFRLLDTAADGKPSAEPLPAAWSQTTNNRVNFSGEVELPIGTCCREVGTLVLKGKYNSNESISGKAIFVASTTDEENCIGFRAMVGTFTATRILANY